MDTPSTALEEGEVQQPGMFTAETVAEVKRIFMTAVISQVAPSPEPVPQRDDNGYYAIVVQMVSEAIPVVDIDVPEWLMLDIEDLEDERDLPVSRTMHNNFILNVMKDWQFNLREIAKLNYNATKYLQKIVFKSKLDLIRNIHACVVDARGMCNALTGKTQVMIHIKEMPQPCRMEDRRYDGDDDKMPPKCPFVPEERKHIEDLAPYSNPFCKMQSMMYGMYEIMCEMAPSDRHSKYVPWLDLEKTNRDAERLLALANKIVETVKPLYDNYKSGPAPGSVNFRGQPRI